MFSLAFSTCPNDTFIFDPIVHRRIDLEGLLFDYRLADIEELNLTAITEKTDMVKVSFHAWLSMQDRYELLNSGSAMGFGNGPLLIARSPIPDERIPDIRIALPGEQTTAHLLFKTAFPQARKKEFMRFSDIEDAILSGEVDAGVIIHENRFTYEQEGLVKIMDLGEYWEDLTQSPIPLGGIVVKKGLGKEVIDKLNRIMSRSVQHAMDHPDEAMPFVRLHAREMDEEVMRKHINLYVNKFTLDPGEEGKRAIQTLIELGNKIDD
ncbi:MAG: 1,4-dihydroxy-6-naphthoate synthase [Bacteroidales bacterium]|nr:1,4-dihydroxy-6-naphthoate synthase [Bacteroidota bacterium]MBL6950111.1 1,4-dihydroxy-6-naphthoate synthase [Bacteroidales bacterium]